MTAFSRVRCHTLLAVMATVMCAATSGTARAQRVNASEGDLQAAFIYNFAKFVEWPADAVPASTMTVEVIGDEALAAALTRIVENRRAQGRSILVRTDAGGRGVHEAQIAVIGSLEDATVAWQLDRIGPRPVLTVGHSARFLQLGGVIRFETIRNRLRFEINADAASRKGLRISAQLLELARGRSK